MFFEWANQGLFFVYFSSFQTHYKFYNKYICEKCPSSIQCRDLNSQPLVHESPPITTRTRLLPVRLNVYQKVGTCLKALYKYRSWQAKSRCQNYIKNVSLPASFVYFWYLSNKQEHFYSIWNWKLSIQCTVLRFEPMTSWTQVSSDISHLRHDDNFI